MKRFPDRWLLPTEKSEIPKWEVRTWYTPPGLVAEFCEFHNLSQEEFVFLQIVENLVRYGSGCFASNQWLCEVMKLKERRLQQIIHQLIENEYLFKETRNGKRYLWTKWSNEMRKKRRKKQQ